MYYKKISHKKAQAAQKRFPRFVPALLVPLCGRDQF
jgi:hypothetical protein